MSQDVADKEYIVYSLNVTDDMMKLSLLSDDDSWKWKMLERLGIHRVGEDTPHQAWLRHLCEKNNIPFTIPVERGLADLILYDVQLRKFSFVLA